jgi:hypothetical protein
MMIAVVLGVLAAVATLALIVQAALRSRDTLCEVCITFRGRTQCREAYGPTQEAAIRTATDNACGLLASGMTDSIQCGKTPPTRTTCPP